MIMSWHKQRLSSTRSEFDSVCLIFCWPGSSASVQQLGESVFLLEYHIVTAQAEAFFHQE
jgi:hypothetical protein